MLHDVVIVGAGPVGVDARARARAGGDLDVVVLDARGAGETLRGDRSLALSHGARLILERLGVWSALAAVPGAVTPITRIDISQAGGFGQMQLAADEQGVPALGYVVSYRALQAALDAALARIGVRSAAWRRGEDRRRHARLRGGRAGGRGRAAAARARSRPSPTAPAPRWRRSRGSVTTTGRSRSIAKLWRAAPHDGARLRALHARRSDRAPAGRRSLRTRLDRHAGPRARALLALDDAAFLGASSRSHFGTRAGGFLRVADRRAFPLVLEFARDPAARALRCARQRGADAASGRGPGIQRRPARRLGAGGGRARHAARALGDRAMLETLFARAAAPIGSAGIAFTHGLVSVFGNDLPFVRWPRGLALTLLDAVPAAKRAFTHAMLFGLR